MSNNGLLKKLTVWDDKAARHILSRTLFGYTQQDLDFALSVSLDDFVDKYLLADSALPQPPDTWVTEVPIPNNSAIDNQRTTVLRNWWLNLMQTQGISFRERMVLFWHNHFTSGISKVRYPQYMYIQNQLYRQFAFGNVKDFAKAVSVDPAMLIYLDGQYNVKGSANENYARELMELFTLGIGNYSETDVKEGARALTGWRVNGLTSEFVQSRFDSGTKTYLGQTGNWNKDDVINIIFSNPQAAIWICTKLYKEFVYYQPNADYINQLAQVFSSNNFEIKPVLSAMIKSDFFQAADIVGSKISGPVLFTVSAIRKFLISNPDNNYLFQNSSQLQQTLFDPPDVRGWQGQRNWISTTTYPMRNIFTDSIINGKSSSGAKLSFSVDVLTFARSFKSSEAADQFVHDVIDYFFQYTLSDAKYNMLLTVLLDGAALYDWSTYDPHAPSRLQNFFKVLMRLAEFQLS